MIPVILDGMVKGTVWLVASAVIGAILLAPIFMHSFSNVTELYHETGILSNYHNVIGH